MTTKGNAVIVREIAPDGEKRIHGVTFDGSRVWFAHDGELVAFDPVHEKIEKRFDAPAASAGTAFDGEHLYQLAKGTILVIDPRDGRVLRSMPAPGKGDDSGMAWGDGHLWIGQYRGARIHKVDPKTGEVVRTLVTERFVTGVTCVDGALWHGAVGGDAPCELRRLGEDGRVEEALRVDVELISGVESAGDGGFWCGGERGRLRLVRRAG